MNKVIKIMRDKGIEVIEIFEPFYQVEFIKDGYYHVRLRGLHFKDSSLDYIIDYINYQFELLEYQHLHK